MEPARKLDEYYTYADYCEWDDDERWELIDGTAYLMAPPLRKHQGALIALLRQFADYLDDKPACKVYIAPFDVLLKAESAEDTKTDTVVQPDLVVICDENKLFDRGSFGPPDLIIEILSPSTAKYDKTTKYAAYRSAGVREYWMVDLEDNTIIVHILNELGDYTAYQYSDSDESISVHVLEDCTIYLGRVFDQ